MSKDPVNKTAVTLGGTPITLFGAFPTVGQTAPAFTLVDKDLKGVAERFCWQAQDIEHCTQLGYRGVRHFHAQIQRSGQPAQ